MSNRSNRVFYKVFLCSLVAILFFVFQYTSAAKIIVSSDQNNHFYDCPFDIQIFIDPQGDDVMGASLHMFFNSGLLLKGFAFDSGIELGFPILVSGHSSAALGFKFPGFFTGKQLFATLRIVQSYDTMVKDNNVLFAFDGTGEITDLTDVYKFGGMEILSEIENPNFLFSEGLCDQNLPILTGDQLQTSFNKEAHLANIYSKINSFLKDNNKPQSEGFLKNYIYYIVLGFVVLCLILFLYYTNKKKKKSFKK